MSITATDIQQQSFGTSRHGYDPQEVDDFLEHVAEEVDNYNLLVAEANSRIKAAEDRALAAEEQASRAVATPAPAAATSGVSEDVISKAFIAAQRSADALKEEARQEAEKLYREAESRSRDIVRDALSEKQKTLGEIDRLRQSSEKFRTDYLSLINHFQTDAQKTFSGFEGLVPAASPAASEEAKEVLRANDAAVAPAAAPAPAAPVHTAPAPAQASFAPEESSGSFNYQDDDDDELDIEEID